MTSRRWGCGVCEVLRTHAVSPSHNCFVNILRLLSEVFAARDSGRTLFPIRSLSVYMPTSQPKSNEYAKDEASEDRPGDTQSWMSKKAGVLHYERAEYSSDTSADPKNSIPDRPNSVSALFCQSRAPLREPSRRTKKASRPIKATTYGSAVTMFSAFAFVQASLQVASLGLRVVTFLSANPFELKRLNSVELGIARYQGAAMLLRQRCSECVGVRNRILTL